MSYYRLCILMQNYSHCNMCQRFSNFCNGSVQYSIKFLHLNFLNTLHEFHGNNTQSFLSPDLTASEAQIGLQRLLYKSQYFSKHLCGYCTFSRNEPPVEHTDLTTVCLTYCFNYSIYCLASVFYIQLVTFTKLFLLISCCFSYYSRHVWDSLILILCSC